MTERKALTTERKVLTEERAKKMVEIADLMLIPATYSLKGKWYVVTFDCSEYVFMFLNQRLKKEFKKKSQTNF